MFEPVRASSLPLLRVTMPSASILFPQNQQNQVLRVREPVLTQQRMIRLGEQPGSRVQPEAELIFQFEFFFHYSNAAFPNR